MLPDFFLQDSLEAGLLEKILPDWSIPLGAIYWVTPPEGPLPKRVEVIGKFLTERLSQQRYGYGAP
jgi:DNA-binding transcriptional LysR family regulator